MGIEHNAGDERTKAFPMLDSMRDAVYHIIRESHQHAHRERIGFMRDAEGV